MNKLISGLFGSFRKKLAAAGIIGLAFALPVAVSAADMVKIEADTTVANVSNSNATWGTSANATYNQVVKVQVVYDNTEAAGSGKVANNLRVKINIPTAAGTTQTITTTTSADNSNTVNGSVRVNLNRSDAYLQYMPGTAVWKHVDAQTGKAVEQKVSDNVVSGNGLVLENENPCQAGSVTVLAGVMVPGVYINKYVRESGTTAWATSITAKANDTVQYELRYENSGNTVEKNVVMRDNLPPNMTLVPGTTMLKSTVFPNGVKVTNDAITTGGVGIGSYAPGSVAYVMFDVKVPGEDKMQCGNNQFRNVGIVQPEGMNESYNTADVNVTKTCANTPVYSCDQFVIDQAADRTVKVSAFKTTQSNGATFKNAVINWGDSSAALTTNNVVGQSHQFAADGTYTVTATAHFTVNGKDVTANGPSCTKTVTFGTPTTPPSNTPPTELVNTGAGDVAGIFAAAAIAGGVAYRLFLGRRLSRQ